MKRYIDKADEHVPARAGEWYERITEDEDSVGDAVYRQHFPDGRFWYVARQPENFIEVPEPLYVVAYCDGTLRQRHDSLAEARADAQPRFSAVAILEVLLDDFDDIARIVAIHQIEG